jgi:hypothetical protein
VRVKISYGVEISEVPTELEQLFDYVYDRKSKLDSQLELVEKLLEEKQLESAVETMDKIRLTLAEMDNRISDVSLIAQGYVDFKKQEHGVNNVSEGRLDLDTVRDGIVGSQPEYTPSDSNHQTT